MHPIPCSFCDTLNSVGLRPNEFLPSSCPHPYKGSHSPPRLCLNPLLPSTHCCTQVQAPPPSARPFQPQVAPEAPRSRPLMPHPHGRDQPGRVSDLLTHLAQHPTHCGCSVKKLSFPVTVTHHRLAIEPSPTAHRQRAKFRLHGLAVWATHSPAFRLYLPSFPAMDPSLLVTLPWPRPPPQCEACRRVYWLSLSWPTLSSANPLFPNSAPASPSGCSFSGFFSSTPAPTKTFSEVIPVWDPSHPPGTRSRGKLHPLPPTTSDSCRPAVFHCLPCPDGPLQTCQPWTTLQTPQSHLDGSQLPCPPKLFPSAPVSPPNPSTWSLSQNPGFVPNSPRPCPVTYLPPLPIATSAALHCSPGHRPCLPVPLSTLQAERAPFQK